MEHHVVIETEIKPSKREENYFILFYFLYINDGKKREREREEKEKEKDIIIQFIQVHLDGSPGRNRLASAWMEASALIQAKRATLSKNNNGKTTVKDSKSML